MRINHMRLHLVCLLLAQWLVVSPAIAAEGNARHPLAIHMNQWLEGSREWTTPNPDHDTGNPGSFTEYRVRWDWGPFRQQLLGKLFGVREDASTMLFWNMYASYNPASATVLFQQIGISGAYIHGEHPVRRQALAFGEVERLDTMMAAPDGSSKMTRHENTFHENGTHQANVYEQGEDGEWVLANQWDWRLVSEDEVLGRGL
ncbi:MAG: hypothetical protein HKO64_11275 [Xanthomonadales bacterium]|nr:hypothetical protein [Xanthomonadales bacterium]NNL96193.1 hypothetical protein [Xanthomonadales bacterium]